MTQCPRVACTAVKDSIALPWSRHDRGRRSPGQRNRAAGSVGVVPRATFAVGPALALFRVQGRTVVANGNIDVGNEPATRTSVQPRLTGAMSQQGTAVIGDNECTPQKLVRLVGCRDPRARIGPPLRPADLIKRQP